MSGNLAAAMARPSRAGGNITGLDKGCNACVHQFRELEIVAQARLPAAPDQWCCYDRSGYTSKKLIQPFMNHIGKSGWILWFFQCGMLPFMPTHFRQPFTSGQAAPLA